MPMNRFVDESAVDEDGHSEEEAAEEAENSDDREAIVSSMEEGSPTLHRQYANQFDGAEDEEMQAQIERYRSIERKNRNKKRPQSSPSPRPEPRKRRRIAEEEDDEDGELEVLPTQEELEVLPTPEALRSTVVWSQSQGAASSADEAREEAAPRLAATTFRDGLKRRIPPADLGRRLGKNHLGGLGTFRGCSGSSQLEPLQQLQVDPQDPTYYEDVFGSYRSNGVLHNLEAGDEMDLQQRTLGNLVVEKAVKAAIDQSPTKLRELLKKTLRSLEAFPHGCTDRELWLLALRSPADVSLDDRNGLQLQGGDQLLKDEEIPEADDFTTLSTSSWMLQLQHPTLKQQPAAEEVEQKAPRSRATQQLKFLDFHERLDEIDLFATIHLSEAFDAYSSFISTCAENDGKSSSALHDETLMPDEVPILNLHCDDEEENAARHAVLKRVLCRLSCLNLHFKLALRAYGCFQRFIQASRQRFISVLEFFKSEGKWPAGFELFARCSGKGQRWLVTAVKKCAAFEPRLGKLILPSGWSLAERYQAANNLPVKGRAHNPLVVEQAVRHTISVAKKHGILIAGETSVMACAKVMPLAHLCPNLPNLHLFAAEKHNPVAGLKQTGEALDAETILRHRQARRALERYLRVGRHRDTVDEPGMHSMDVYRSILPSVKELVAFAHRDSAGPSHHSRYVNSAAMLSVVPGLVTTVDSSEVDRDATINPHKRAFLDGFINTSLDNATLQPATPVVIPHSSARRLKQADVWGSGRAMKAFPYLMSGASDPGVASFCDGTSTHLDVPRAVHYRSIITSQPGDVLTHGHNMATDGQLLYRKDGPHNTQTAKVVIGTASTGKSTQIAHLVSLFSQKLVASIGGQESIFCMQKVTEETMLAFVQEMGHTMGLSTTQLQEAIAGDLVTFAVKHHDASEFAFMAQIIMGGNRLGPWTDTAGSMLRRLCLFYYIVRIRTSMVNANSLLMRDSGPTLLCISTAYWDLLRLEKAFFGQRGARDGVYRAQVGERPGPLSGERVLLHYAHYVSAVAAAVRNGAQRFVFAELAKTAVAVVAATCKAVMETPGSSKASWQDFTEETVAAYFVRLGCEVVVVAGEKILCGVAVVPDRKHAGAALVTSPDDWELLPRLAGLILVGWAQEYVAFQFGNGGAVGNVLFADLRNSKAPDGADQRFQPELRMPRSLQGDSDNAWDPDEAIWRCVSESLKKSYSALSAAMGEGDGKINIDPGLYNVRLWDVRAMGEALKGEHKEEVLGFVQQVANQQPLDLDDLRQLEKYVVGASVNKMYPDMVREADHAHAQNCWRLKYVPASDAAAKYLKRAISTPRKFVPPSPYTLAKRVEVAPALQFLLDLTSDSMKQVVKPKVKRRRG